MSATIIHEYLPFSEKGAWAEKKVLDYLRSLPIGYFVIRECKIDSTSLKKARGSQEGRSDFVVVGPSIGVVILEVKDWNIWENSYEYEDQYRVRKTHSSGKSELLDNPLNQAKEYLDSVKQVLFSSKGDKDSLWISSFVVYPKLSRADFESRITGIQSNNTQQQFIYNSQRILFKEDLNNTPLKLLETCAMRNAQIYKRSIESYSDEQVLNAVHRLIPSELRVPQLDNDAEKKFTFLDKKQQEWAFSESLAGKMYLADVAGSGKTNVLLSRAIYKAKQHLAQGGCRILVLTYSEALLIELKRIFRAKIADDPDYDYFYHAISLFDITSLMEEIVKKDAGNEAPFKSWRSEIREKHSESNYIDEVLPQHCIDILMKHQKMCQVYDYLFVDEIQDFSTWFLAVALDLLKNQNNIFAVGDVAQKLFDRELDWSEFDIVKQRAELERRFFMYRSPRPVAKLAWRFLTSDRFIEGDLKDEGYETEVKIKSPFTHPPEFLAETTDEGLLQCVVKDIQSRLSVAQRKQLLCIGLKDKLLGKLYQALTAASVPVCWATEVSLISGDYVVLADYVEAKGLEREYVYILDADNLAAKGGPFATEEQIAKALRRDRIKLFVALTRAMREVQLYYIDSYHTFIRQLLQIESTL